jgi:hypothetical protein
LENVQRPLVLDVNDPDHWSEIRNQCRYDGVFSANTAHIMHWPEVVNMVSGIGRLLPNQGLFLLYGPFNRNGEFTSDSNAKFDSSLRLQDPEMGIRNDVDLIEIAESNRLIPIADLEMPANNRILGFQKRHFAPK